MAFEKGDDYTGRVIGATTDQTFTVLKIGASNVNIFAGSVPPSTATGLQLSQVDFAHRAVSSRPPPAAAAPTSR